MKRHLVTLAFLFFLVLPNAASAALSTNLVSYWKFDESSGNAADSVGSNTLTNNNTTPYVAAKINNGADLERGSSQYFNISDASQSGLDFSDTLTFGGWVKFESFDAVDSTDPIIFKRESAGNQRAYDLYLRGSGFLHWDSYTDGSSLGCNVEVAWSPSTATWYRIDFSKSGTSAKFYVNGSQQGTTQTCANATIYNASSALEFGSFLAIPQYLDGVVDEWGMWSRALSDAEITSLYNSGSGCAYPFSACEGAAGGIAPPQDIIDFVFLKELLTPFKPLLAFR